MKKRKDSNFTFTAYITLKDGRKIYARQFGKKAFCIPVNKKLKKVDWLMLRGCQVTTFSLLESEVLYGFKKY